MSGEYWRKIKPITDEALARQREQERIRQEEAVRAREESSRHQRDDEQRRRQEEESHQRLRDEVERKMFDAASITGEIFQDVLTNSSEVRSAPDQSLNQFYIQEGGQNVRKVVLSWGNRAVTARRISDLAHPVTSVGNLFITGSKVAIEAKIITAVISHRELRLLDKLEATGGLDYKFTAGLDNFLQDPEVILPTIADLLINAPLRTMTRGIKYLSFIPYREPSKPQSGSDGPRFPDGGPGMGI